MLTIIPLPEGFVNSVIGYMGDIIVDLSPLLTLIIGVIVGTLVIVILIDAIRGHR